jgi:two-component system sensor histidine kinase KdpD
MRAAMQLAEELGARTETLAGNDMVKAVAGYVRRHNLTKVLVGRAPADWYARGTGSTRRAWLARALSPMLGVGNRLFGRQMFADALAAGCPRST